MKTTMMTTILLAVILMAGCTQTVSPTAPEAPCDPEIESCETDEV